MSVLKQELEQYGALDWTLEIIQLLAQVKAGNHKTKMNVLEYLDAYVSKNFANIHITIKERNCDYFPISYCLFGSDLIRSVLHPVTDWSEYLLNYIKNPKDYEISAEFNDTSISTSYNKLSPQFKDYDVTNTSEDIHSICSVE